MGSGIAIATSGHANLCLHSRLASVRRVHSSMSLRLQLRLTRGCVTFPSLGPEREGEDKAAKGKKRS